MKRYGIFTRDVTLVLLAGFFFMVSPMMVTPLVAGFGESMGAGGVLMGVLAAATNICSLCFRPVTGMVVDRISRYKWALIGNFFVTLACVGYVLSTSPLMLLGSRLVHGVGFAFSTVCTTVWMADLLPEEKVGAGMGVYGAVNALSMAIGPTLGVFLYRHYGYRAAFAAALVFCLLATVTIHLISERCEPKEVAEKKPLRILDKNVIFIALTLMLFGIPYFATQSFLLTYAGVRGVAANVAYFFLLYAFFVFFTRLIMKNLFDTLSFGKFIAMGSVSALLAIVCLHFLSNYITLVLAGLFMAGGYGLMCTVCQAEAIRHAAPGSRGLAGTTLYMGMDLGMILGPLIAGVLYAHLPVELFYPALAITVPMCGIVYVCEMRRRFAR